jgi:hypothetical protein
MSEKQSKRRQNNDNAAGDQSIYKICVEGLLDERWSGYLSDFSISHQPNDISMLVGEVRDQAELFGVLLKIRDLGIRLLEVKQLDHHPDFP